MKKKYGLLLWGTLTCASFSFIVALEEDDIDSAFDVALHEEPEQAQCPVECPATCEDLLELIAPGGDDCPPLLNVPVILQQNLYLHTTGPVTLRPLLDEPSLIPYCFATCNLLLTAQPFLNYTPTAYFTHQSPFLKDYIDLTNQNIINEVACCLDTLECSDVDVPGLLGLFANMKLRVYRAGAMFGVCKNWDCFNIRVRIPLYLLVEHFNLTEGEQERVSAMFQTFQSQFGLPDQGSKDEEERFGRQNLAMDKFGTGDARINALYAVHKTPETDIWLGLQVTLPTASTWVKGYFAGEFDPESPQPQFSLLRYYQLLICPEGAANKDAANKVIQDEATTFLVGALRRLSTILINAPLGNGGHFGAGPQVNIVQRLNPCLTANFYGAVEFFNRHTEDRFFLVRKEPAEFDRDWQNPDRACQNLEFLDQQVVNTFYPLGVRAEIRPGAIIKTNYALHYASNCYYASIGLDAWRQAAEHLELTCEPVSPYTDSRAIQNLDVEKAFRSSAYQLKVFGAFGYFSEQGLGPSCAWSALFTWDATFANNGVGKDFTVGFRFGFEF